ncbi:MAG: PilZ domain-containing protein [Candidatus Zixiibacteriota bacterium]
MFELRKLKRMHVMSYIRINEQKTDNNFGHLMDITTEGMRLCGDQPIEPAAVYKFTMRLPHVDFGKKEIVFDANVVWCQKDKLFDLYDAGIQLRDISNEDRQVIEDFIQYSTFEERWLSGTKVGVEYA